MTAGVWDRGIQDDFRRDLDSRIIRRGSAWRLRHDLFTGRRRSDRRSERDPTRQQRRGFGWGGVGEDTEDVRKTFGGKTVDGGSVDREPL